MDDKWFARVEAMAATLEDFDLHVPELTTDARERLTAARQRLEAEKGRGLGA